MLIDKIDRSSFARCVITFRTSETAPSTTAWISFNGHGGAYIEADCQLNQEQAEKLTELAGINRPQHFKSAANGYVFRYVLANPETNPLVS